MTILGISNVSFGLNPVARKIVNAVFLYHAVEAGLDLAIVHPSHVVPFAEIPADERELAEDLVLARRPDALQRFKQTFTDLASTINGLDDNPLPASYEVRLRSSPAAGVGSCASAGSVAASCSRSFF